MIAGLPIVSVIIPVYNVEKYLSECLTSIINQTYRNLEIILVDDGSTDGSGDICDKYAQNDSRIKVIHNVNGGVSLARNIGIDISKGEWIYFMDSDDIIENETINESLNTSLKDGTDMCFFDYDVFNGKERKRHCAINSSESVFTDLQHIKTFIDYFSGMGSIWNFIVKSEFLKRNLKFDESINISEDELFKLQVYGQIKSFSYLHKVLYHYRISVNSACGKAYKLKKYPEMMKDIYIKMLKTINNGNYPENAVIVPNTRLISRINAVVRIAFQNKLSLKCDYEIIKNFINSDECQKALLNYDKNTIQGKINRIYILLKRPNRIFITLVYFLSKIMNHIRNFK